MMSLLNFDNGLMTLYAAKQPDEVMAGGRQYRPDDDGNRRCPRSVKG